MTTEPAEEIPGTAVRIKTDNPNAWPGGSVIVRVEPEDPQSERPGDLRLDLVNQTGVTLVSAGIRGPETNLPIPEHAEPGEYSLRVRWNSWCLDSIPFEIAARQIVEMTRKLLRASILQARALELAEQKDTDEAAVLKLCEEVETLYVECDEGGLASLTWKDIATALRHSGRAAASAEANSRADKAGGRYARALKIITRLNLDTASSALDRRFVTLDFTDLGTMAFDPVPALLGRAFESRLSRYRLHAGRHDKLRVELVHVGANIRGPRGVRWSSQPRKRGSAPWVLQRLTSDVFSGLLSDLVVYRDEGLPSATANSLDRALSESGALFERHESSQAAATVHSRLTSFARSFRKWLSIEGADSAARVQRDALWGDLRMSRLRIARTLAHSSDELQRVLPGPEVIIGPYIEVATGDTRLVETTLAVSRVARRLQQASGDK